MRKRVLLLLLTCWNFGALAQQYGMYNTGTLFDSFENPSQKVFQVDSSRKYAFNFLLPTIALDATFTGPAQQSFKDLVFKSLINGDLPIGENKNNTLAVNSNNYLLMFKIFKNIYWNREVGFSWQIRQSGNIRTTNESLVLLDNIRRFSSPEDFKPDMFNNRGYNQLYHQFSMTYREDLTRRIGLGAKLSLLSGAVYNKFDIERSDIRMEESGYAVNLNGTYRSSFGFDTLDVTTVLPDFKNPGLSVSLSANYKAPGGWYLLGNLKDLGLIRWNRSSFTYDFSGDVLVDNTNSSGARRDMLKDVKSFLVRNSAQGSIIAPTDGKAEVLLEKDMDWYRPNVILSKSLFYPGGDAALINHFEVNHFLFTVSGGYNFNNYFKLGGQAMYKTPNFEFFLGSEQLFKTYYSGKNAIFRSSANGRGYTAASAYFGLGFKFGPVREHPLNARSIPGVDNLKQDSPGFFQKLRSKIQRKNGRRE